MSSRRSTSHALLTRTGGKQLCAEVISVMKWFDWNLARGSCDQMARYSGTIEWLNEWPVNNPQAPSRCPEYASHNTKISAVLSIEMGNNCFPNPLLYE